MKVTDQNKSIRTAPEGAWESGLINQKENHPKKQNPNDITTDIQGNGYPISQKNLDN